MSSSSKGGRSTKGCRGGSNKNSGGGTTHNEQSKTDHHITKENVPHKKDAPTADQLRIAQMIDNTHSEPEKVLQEKMCQIVQVTGVSSDQAIVALHDCNSDVNAAIDRLLEGEDQGEWRETNTKKKKKVPATKAQSTKEDSESNKENRRVDNRERSNSRRGSGAPRFRGRGGGNRNNKDDSEGSGMGRGGSNSRRRGISNGTSSMSRGRGSRGRGGNSSMGSRTFQKRQPPGFTETIDTWGAPSPEKIDNSVDNLQIDNWDEEISGTTEDWDGEWTGSLDKSTVFAPSSGGEPPSSSAVNHSSALTTAEPPEQMMPESVSNVLSLGAQQTHNLNQAIEIALLQKAAPHSTLGRLAPPSSLVDRAPSSLVDRAPPLVNDTKSTLLSGIVPPPDPSINATVTIPGSQSYPSPSLATMNNSMFSNAAPNLGSSLSSGSGMSKLLGLSPPSLAARSKQQNRRMPHVSSKIPSSAVEMPEVAMAALDMQFTGLEFGTETFDFTSDVKPVMGNSMISGPAMNARDPSGSVANDLNSRSSSLSQPQPQRGPPQPIPFPSQANERKNLLSSSNQRSSTGSSGNSNTTASGNSLVGDLAAGKKENLSSLVGTGGGGGGPSSSYQSSASTAYKPSFPSPPSAAQYSQNQNYSNNASSGVNNSNSYGGSSVNNASNSVGSSNDRSSQSSGGYGSNYSASAAGGQYQNNYVNAPSHSLTNISVPKTLAGLKDNTSQSYNDSVATTGNLSGSLSTSASVGGSNSGGSGLASSLNSASNSVQSAKPSVPGKSVNSLGTSAPPGVQQHSASQQQHQVTQQSMSHQQQHHLQQQQQVAPTQQTQLMAGPSQYVSPQAPIQGAYYNVQQPAMYSIEDLQMFQQRIPHMQTAPTTMTGGRDGNVSTPASYSAADAAKFRTDQNSSPVPSTINQQGATAGGAYITQNAALPPFYMYQTMPPVPSNFTQYGTPAIIQIPPNTHTGSSNTQFQGPPKLPYGGSSTYYDGMSQTQDYKMGYNSSGSQGQSKTGPNSSGSASNSASDLPNYKNHLSGKVNRNYDKTGGYHTANPQTYNLPAGSGTNPIAANYGPMFIPTMPSQHHSQLLHHPLHPDGTSSGGQRSGSGGSQNKGGSKSGFTTSYWGN